MNYAERIQARVEKLDLDRDDDRKERQKLIRELRQELDEVQQRIPTWDRIIFFSDTPDEAREEVLEKEIEAQQKALNEHYDDLERRLQSITSEYPPFAIATILERCLRASRTGQSVKALINKHARGQGLASVLEELANQIRELYTPDFDQESLDQLQRRSRCESLARDSDSIALEDHDQLGFAPISINQLLPLCAKRLLETDFFETKARCSELLKDERQLLKEYESSEESVPLLDKLNVFSQSESQNEASDLRQRYESLQNRRKQYYEESRRQFHSSLSAYPPLNLYQRLIETAAITRLLKEDSEPTISVNGEIIFEPIDRYGALQILAINQLLSSFTKAFPELRLPSSLSYKTQEARRFPTVVQLYIDQLDRSVIPNDCSEALEHVFLKGHLDHQISEVKKNISLIDRINFWTETEAEASEEKLDSRMKWNEYWTDVIWSDILSEARKQGQNLGPFRLRDITMLAIDAVDKIHTDSGSSSFSIDCKVYGREQAFDILDKIYEVFERDFYLEGHRDDLLAAVYRALQDDTVEVPEETRRRRFSRLSYEDLIVELAKALNNTRFCVLYNKANELTNKLSSLEEKKGSAESQISLWDRINVFTSSEEEDLRDDLKAMIEFDNDDLHSTLHELNSLFNNAIRLYPAARHYFELQGVSMAVRGIRALCQRYTRTRGTGKDRKSETRYRCVIRGHDAAKNTMRRWASGMVQQFGQLPGYQALLESWALTKFER